MIPKIIHYCWFGGKPKPELVEQCMESWHRCMPDLTSLSKPLSPTEKGDVEGWAYMEWSEGNFDIASAPLYVRQAYEAKKYAFVSDYVRLWALEQYGGLYMDVDFEVFKSFVPLLNNHAFVGFEGSKRKPIMMGVCASEPHGQWIKEQLASYANRPFVLEDGSLDLLPNTWFITANMEKNGFVADGNEKDYEDLHVYPVDYFCPIQTSGEDLTSSNTYCTHRGLHSWSGKGGWKERVLAMVGPKWKVRIIKLKRKLLG